MVLLGRALANFGYPTLMIDADPQHNLTTYLDLEVSTLSNQASKHFGVARLQVGAIAAESTSRSSFGSSAQTGHRFFD